MSPGTEQRKLAAIMFTDMVGYSALAQRNEALALELLEEHRRVVRGLLPRHGGREVKTTGDGFLLEFPSALAAVQGAVEIQNALHERNQVSPPERQLRIRIGIHVGDVVMRDGDIHGDGVNIAARIEPLAAAGGICVSEDVERQVRNKLPQMLTALGPAELKNIVLPVVVHRVTMPWETTGSSRREEAHAKRGTGSQSLVTSAATKFGWIAALLLLAVGAGWWLVHQSGKATKQVASSPVVTNSPAAPVVAPVAARSPSLARIMSLAVKPLDDFSGDTNNAYLSDGMTEELCLALGNVSALRVPGRPSVMRFKGGQKSISEMAKELNVEAILAGSIQRAGNRIKITVQLIDAATDRQLWGTNFQRDLSDFFAVQSEVARAVVKEIQVHLTPQEEARLARTQKVDPDAVAAYLKGREHWNRFTREGFQKAMEACRTAIGIDPTFIAARAFLAGCYSALANNEFLPPQVGFAKSREEIDKVLQMEETFEAIQVDAALRMFFEWDWAGAKRSLDRTLALNPNHALTHQLYSLLLTRLGPPFTEAMDHARRAVELEPMIPIASVAVARVLYFSGRYEEAIQEFRKVAGSFPWFVHVQNGLGWAYLKNGQPELALAVFEKALEAGRAPVYLAGKGAALARLGRSNEARKMTAEIRELYDRAARAQDRYVSPVHLAVVHAALGEGQLALEWLEIAVEERSPNLWLLNVDPAFESIRPEARFQTVLKKMSLDP